MSLSIAPHSNEYDTTQQWIWHVKKVSSVGCLCNKDCISAYEQQAVMYLYAPPPPTGSFKCEGSGETAAAEERLWPHHGWYTGGGESWHLIPLSDATTRGVMPVCSAQSILCRGHSHQSLVDVLLVTSIHTRRGLFQVIALLVEWSVHSTHPTPVHVVVVNLSVPFF